MSEPIFRVDALPARDGDCLLVEWGKNAADVHRMLIDGGRSGPRNPPSGLLAALRRIGDRANLDLVVASHIDCDHLDGLVTLLREPDGPDISEFWFNALRHLPHDDTPAADDILGWRAADRLDRLVEERVIAQRSRWNERLGIPAERHAIFVPDRGPLPATTVHGMTVTLLSPTRDQLATVRDEWPSVLKAEHFDSTEPVGDDDAADADDVLGDMTSEDAGISPRHLANIAFSSDTSPANAASIAFIAEFCGRRVLFGADAYASTLVHSLGRYQNHGKVQLAMVKLPHHGSAGNLSQALIERLDCPVWLCSTNGAIHQHPNRRAIARIICRTDSPHLVFNYHSVMTEEWGRPSTRMEFGFTSFLPPPDHPGCRCDVLAGTVEELPKH